MRPFSSAFPASFLTGLVLLYQVSWMEAAPSRPAVRKQDIQTLILPCYLKSSPLSEKKIVFRKTLSSFPFTEKNPRIHQFIREYPSLTFDERISLFVQRTAMGKTPGDVCARLNELTALMDYRKMKQQQRLSCLAAFLEDALLYASSRRYAPLDLEALSLAAFLELEMDEGCPASLRERILAIWESAAISLETGNDLQRKLAALLFAQALRYGKKDPYLMARCGFRLANLYIRMKEPQKARLAASFIPPIRGMEGSRALIQKWTAPPSRKKKRRQ